MNAVEIEAAVSELAIQPFNAAEFPLEFLAAFSNNTDQLEKLFELHTKMTAAAAKIKPSAKLKREKTK
jgi:hypothetical protein